MTKLRDFAGRLGANRAIGYAITMRAWQVPAGVVTTLLIALCFDEHDQGVYYTLLSIVGLQALADSGLLNVIMHAVSHEWAELDLDHNGFLRGSRRVRGRVAGIARFGLIWFFFCSLALVVAGTAFGVALFFGQGVSHRVLPPLVGAMLLAGCSLSLSPMIAVLEGCNQVSEVNRYRLMQALTGSVVVWSCLVGGAGLWTPAAAVLVQLVWECFLLFRRYRTLVIQLWKTPATSFDWKVEIWPLQWRIGIQSAAKYFAFFPLIPVLFAWQGPELAGRVGMTWAVLNALLSASYAWVRTRAPELGSLIASGKQAESRYAFIRATVGSALLLAIVASSFLIALASLVNGPFEIGNRIASRFLDPYATFWFAIAVIPLHLIQCFSIHIRAYRIDPIWKISIVGNLALAGAICYTASAHGASSVGIAMLVTFTVIAVLMFRLWGQCDRLYRIGKV